MTSLRRLRYASLGIVPSVVSFLLLPPLVRAQEYQIGIFFDEGANSCVAELANQSEIAGYVFAIVPEGTELNGAIVGLDVPPGLIVVLGAIQPKDVTQVGDLTSSGGMDVTLQKCPIAAGPIPLANLRVIYENGDLPGGTIVPDLQLLLRGGASQADSLSYVKPQVKICPEDPLGGEPTFLDALGLRSTLNCSSDCPCVTSVAKVTWGWIKELFRGP